MAKWGEGDSRWEVEERADGHNLNDWHWVEKNIVQWSQKELEKRFASLQIYDGAKGLFTFNGVKKLDGSICAHVRRGRRFIMYDYNVSFKFSGRIVTSDGSEKMSGFVKIPYMGDENDFDEFDYEVHVEDGPSSEKAKTKNIIHQECKKVLRNAMKEFMEHMNDVWTKGPSLQSDSKSEVVRTKMVEEPKESASKTPSQVKETVTKSEGKGSNLAQKVTLNGPVEMIFQTFLDSDRLQAFTQSPAKIDPRVGGSFNLFSGNVTGVFTEIETMKRIAQKWRFNDWKEGQFSKVILTFDSSGGQTTINLSHQNIPQSDIERAKEGWNRFYWNNFRNIFGGSIGAFL